ncbi:MAG: DUF4097 family beta strand repeat protein [Acidobacteria bacterium]|nr:DUF4097 family beta strand repeat protein [Acidobacteriota bacterium]
MTIQLPARMLVAILSLAVLGSAACDLAIGDFQEQHTERWSQSYELEAGGRLELHNVNGKIDVQSSPGRTVEIVAEKTARAASVEMAKQALERVTIEENATPRAIRINTRFDRTDAMFNRSGNVNVRYTVRVPADVELEFATTNGGIELTGAGGRTTLTTTNGGIKAREVAGPLEARTTNGGLEIDLAAVAEGGIRLGCTNGGIDLTLPADAKASIDASVTNGGIRTGNLRLDTVESSRRRLEANLNGGGPRIDARCTNGGLNFNGR